MPLPGADDAPPRPMIGTPLPRGDMPVSRQLPPLPPLPTRPSSMPAPRHTFDSALGDGPPRPMATPPVPPTPDPLGQALSDFDRDRAPGAAPAEPRPWRPREVPEEPASAAEPPQRRFRRAGAAVGAAAGGAERSRHTPSQLREGRRLLALFGAATLVMLVVGLVSGRTSSPLPSNSTTAQSSNPAPGAQQPGSSQPAAQPPAPAPSAAAPQPPAQKPVAPPAPAVPALTGVKALGDGGTGYQVRAFRYGQHPNDFRIVLDFDAAGSASGTPRATVGFLDNTTLLVVLDNVVPAGSTGQLPNTGTVAGVSLMQPSPFPNAVTYQIKLAHPVTFTAGYIPGPLRLVLDLAG
jgi:hypothetical protein